MTSAPRLETVKRLVPAPLKTAIKTGSRALYLAPPSSRLPPRGYRLEDYKRWFSKSADVFLRYLKQTQPQSAMPKRDGRFAVVVMPWVSTPVPWYACMLGLGLLNRGQDVTFIWDDTQFPDVHLDLQNRCIGTVLDWIGRFYPVEKLSDHVGMESDADDRDAIRRLTDLNVSWVVRGAPPTEDQRVVVEKIGDSLATSLPLIKSVLSRCKPHCLVVPGGVYRTSGLFLREARSGGSRVATFDTDLRIAQICVDGVAAQNGDIPTAFRSLQSADREVRDQAMKVALAELQDRSANRDQYGFQALPARSDRNYDGCVLIPLNVEWDTAALGRHVHFEDSSDWLITTVSAVLAEDAGSVVVRQHPSERRPLQRSRLDVRGLLRRTFGDDPRCRFVAAEDAVSSYDLLRSARLVLPFVSTIGIEAAAMGKPVLISGACYYADLGFVWSARSREEYFDLLRRGIRGSLIPRADQVERALLCYYLTAVRNRVVTDFTPHPDDFWTWCQRPFLSLLSDPAVVDILDAVETGVPISLLRHTRAWNGCHGSPDRSDGTPFG
jgi:Capsule polysaccharide biosynthesis protein